jgi:hypothetical protein
MGKFLPWLQARIRHWVKPASPTLVVGLLSDLPRSRTDLHIDCGRFHSPFLATRLAQRLREGAVLRDLQSQPAQTTRGSAPTTGSNH